MIRTILGYAALAIAALVLLKVAFTLFGLVLGVVVSVLVLAALGYGMYLVLFFVSPGTAARVKALVTGAGNRPAAPTAIGSSSGFAQSALAGDAGRSGRPTYDGST